MSSFFYDDDNDEQLSHLPYSFWR